MNLKLTIVGAILIVLGSILIYIGILNNDKSIHDNVVSMDDRKILTEYDFIKHKEMEIKKLYSDIERFSSNVDLLRKKKNRSVYEDELYINLQKNILNKKIKYNGLVDEYNSSMDIFTDAYGDTKIFNDSIIFMPPRIKHLELYK